MIRNLSLVSAFNCRQIVKYYSVGGGVNIVGYLLFLWLVSVGFGHKLVASGLYVVGTFVSFILNRKFVFDGRSALCSSISALFFMMVFGYIANMSMLYFFVDVLGFRSGIVQFFAVGLVSVCFFFFNKLFVHRGA